jgi:hypothetical protein
MADTSNLATTASFHMLYTLLFTDVNPSDRADEHVGLWPFASCNSAFEFRREFFASGRSLVQSSSTVYVCVIECDQVKRIRLCTDNE